MLPISAFDIEKWAATKQAEFDLPCLIAQLILASCPDVQDLYMPSGKHATLSGYDGMVTCAIGNAFVPPDESVWELSVREDIEVKAKEDYTARTEDSLGKDKSQNTFVFATARSFPSGNRWSKDCHPRPWRNVRALWSEHLAQWLNMVPWIAASFGRAIDKPVTGIRSMQMVWNDYASVPKIEMNATLVLGGRQDATRNIQEWLMDASAGRDQMIRFSAPSVREAVDFIGACVHTLTDVDRIRIENQVFVIEDADAAQRLGRLHTSHVVVVTSPEAIPHMVRSTRDWGCRLIIPINDEVGGVVPLPQLRRLVLPPIPRENIVRSLIDHGLKPQYAVEVCEHNGFDYDRIRRSVFMY
jgi:hypothetical protein